LSMAARVFACTARSEPSYLLFDRFPVSLLGL
jgi:hypothetical protein